MSHSPSIKLTSGALEIAKALINGKALAVSKTETKAYLVFGDYSFYKDVQHWHFDELKDKGLLTRIDTRVASIFYTLNEKGIEASKSQSNL